MPEGLPYGGPYRGSSPAQLRDVSLIAWTIVSDGRFIRIAATSGKTDRIVHPTVSHHIQHCLRQLTLP